MTPETRQADFERLYLSHFAPLMRYATRKMANPDHAFDLVHEVFAETWRASAINPHCFTQAYLFRSLRNLIIDWRRGWGRRPQEPIDYESEYSERYPATTDWRDEVERRIYLDAALDALPPAQRAVYRMQLNDYDQDEIVQDLSVSDLAVRALRFRGAQTLRSRLTDIAPGPRGSVPLSATTAARLATLLQAKRAERRLSIRAAATQIGISHSNLSLIEAVRAPAVRRPTLQRLATFLGVSLAELEAA